MDPTEEIPEYISIPYARFRIAGLHLATIVQGFKISKRAWPDKNPTAVVSDATAADIEETSDYFGGVDQEYQYQLQCKTFGVRASPERETLDRTVPAEHAERPDVVIIPDAEEAATVGTKIENVRVHLSAAEAASSSQSRPSGVASTKTATKKATVRAPPAPAAAALRSNPNPTSSARTAPSSTPGSTTTAERSSTQPRPAASSITSAASKQAPVAPVVVAAAAKNPTPTKRFSTASLAAPSHAAVASISTAISSPAAASKTADSSRGSSSSSSPSSSSSSSSSSTTPGRPLSSQRIRKRRASILPKDKTRKKSKKREPETEEEKQAFFQKQEERYRDAHAPDADAAERLVEFVKWLVQHKKHSTSTAGSYAGLVSEVLRGERRWVQNIQTATEHYAKFLRKTDRTDPNFSREGYNELFLEWLAVFMGAPNYTAEQTAALTDLGRELFQRYDKTSTIADHVNNAGRARFHMVEPTPFLRDNILPVLEDILNRRAAASSSSSSSN